MVLTSTPSIFSFVLIFPNFTKKCPSITGLVTKRVKCKNKGASQYRRDNRCKRADHRQLSVCYKTPLSMKTCRARFNVKLTSRHGPDQQSSRTALGPWAGLCRPLIYCHKHLCDSYNVVSYWCMLSVCRWMQLTRRVSWFQYQFGVINSMTFLLQLMLRAAVYLMLQMVTVGVALSS